MLFPSGYTFQWVRVDGVIEMDITSATSSTYTLTTAEVGKTVKVKVSFTDGEGTAENPLVSDAYPATGTVRADGLRLSYGLHVVRNDDGGNP